MGYLAREPAPVPSMAVPCGETPVRRTQMPLFPSPTSRNWALSPCGGGQLANSAPQGAVFMNRRDTEPYVRDVEDGEVLTLTFFRYSG